MLGQYRDGLLEYKGHVTLGVSGHDFKRILSAKRRDNSPFEQFPSSDDDVVWLEPTLVGVIKYMEKTASGSMRQPVFKGLRDDKTAKDCTTE